LGGEEHQASGGTFVRLGGSLFYNTSKQSFINAEISKSSESGYILRARGFIDTVVQIQACAAQGKILKDWSLSFFAPLDLSFMGQFLVAGKTLNENRPPESYANVFENILPLIFPDSIFYSIYDLRRPLLGRPLEIKYSNLAENPTYLSVQPEALNFLQRVADCVWNRRVIKTSENRFGLVPKATETNDLIAFLLGCSIPVVI
jgi:hypothetical protein